jgi:MOSC domain-containing protein YiiM
VSVLVSANVGRSRPLRIRGRDRHSAIDKRPVAGPVGVHRLGLDGDVQVERRHHGGRDQAVYAYAAEDLEVWAGRLGRPLPPGSFGENLTVSGLDVTESRIGERWRIGTVLLEIDDVRTPCHTFQAWLGEPGWIKRFRAEGRPGAYLRVLETGTVQAGDPLEVVERRDHDLTVGLMFRALTTERELLPRFLAEPRTRAKVLARARRYVAARAPDQGAASVAATTA